ncbi:ADP-ribose pyrophosphatase YjhB, NUDIX family [Gracilibacillus orientalis]|uniref:ADP-ribose pyrophosphatase YjhB, NUDIX family n=1 Tax=Gracilibacillus orientalis TaxID=334253 RepID=A0A1I4Q474_9BACI|nr:NUDIX domain-containing protein [Gracilibacillus orientalis]SFM34423.1 ADP-ribose pyrophosphatase YjhB, NUDIX family [Gracilibacillus orientalis]
MAKDRFKVIPAVHIFLLKDDQILLLRRYNTGYQDGNYSVPAGHLEGDEDVIVAAQREVLEEAGITISYQDLSIVGVMHRKATKEERVDFFLIADKWGGDVVNKEPDKCDELAWYPLNKLPDNMIPYVSRAIKNYKDDKPFDVYGFI